MTRITFLHGARDRRQALLDWLTQTRPQQARVMIFEPDPAQRAMLDRFLWTQPATGFLPHCQANSPLADQTPIVITDLQGPPQHDEILINLSNELPPGFSRFQELIEVISTHDEDRLPGRERFRFYRERGYPLESRDISKGAAP